MRRLTSKGVRTDALFLRNGVPVQGRWGIPLVKKQEIRLDNIDLIACSRTRLNDSPENRAKGVHFFVDDYRFMGVYNNPAKSFQKFSQYAFLLTPDFSTYVEMKPWRQIESVAHNRWCGAYWQSRGLIVIPTVSWSTRSSFDYCFDGVERGAIVAVGTVGCMLGRRLFMDGYAAMLDKLCPEAVICFGTPFDGMKGNVIPVSYSVFGKENR